MSTVHSFDDDPAPQSPAQIPPADPISQNFPEFPAGENDLSDKPLSDRQINAVYDLLSGKSLHEVAEEIGVDRRTLYNWRRDPRFIAELRYARRDLWQDAADQIRALIHPAIHVLSRELHNNYDRARFRAAATILRLSNLRSAVPVDDGGDDS